MPELPSQEAARRFSIGARVRFQTLDEGPFDGRLINLSMTGMFVATEHLLEPGARIGFAFAMQPLESPVRGQGSVVWVREDDSETRPAGIGVRFRRLEEAGDSLLRSRLERFLATGESSPSDDVRSMLDDMRPMVGVPAGGTGERAPSEPREEAPESTFADAVESRDWDAGRGEPTATPLTESVFLRSGTDGGGAEAERSDEVRLDSSAMGQEWSQLEESELGREPWSDAVDGRMEVEGVTEAPGEREVPEWMSPQPPGAIPRRRHQPTPWGRILILALILATVALVGYLFIGDPGVRSAEEIANEHLEPGAGTTDAGASAGAGSARGGSTNVDDAARRAEVRRAVRTWIEAWTSQDVATYLDCYSSAFEPPEGVDLETWRRQREDGILTPDRIRVAASDIEIVLQGDRATVKFLQLYRSDGFSDRTPKELVFAREGGSWKIVQEWTRSTPDSLQNAAQDESGEAVGS